MKQPSSQIPNHAFALFALIAIAFFLLAPVTFGGKVLLPADFLLLMVPWKHHAKEMFPDFQRVQAPLLDVIQQYYPWRKFYAQSLHEGILPLWNPYMFCGTPFVANGQSAIFYPLNLLFLLMDTKQAFGWVALIHLLIAGFGMYAFLCAHRLRPLSAFVGAVTWMLCGFFMAWLCYTSLLCTGAWLSWALFFFEKAFAAAVASRQWKVASQRSQSRYCLLPTAYCLLGAGVVLGMVLLGGHFQIAFYVWFAFGLYVLLRASQARFQIPDARFQRKAVILYLVSGIVVAFVGLAIGASQLLPSLELSTMSTRAGVDDPQAVVRGRLPAEQLIRLLVPHFFGNYRDTVLMNGTEVATHWHPFDQFNFIEFTGYVGILPLLLSGIALAFKHKLRPYGATMLAVSLLMALGTPLIHLFAIIIPAFKQLTGASRALYLFDFSVALLAAVGMERLLKASSGEQRRIAFSLLTASLLMAFIVRYGWGWFKTNDFFLALKDYETYQLFRFALFFFAGLSICFLAPIASSPARLIAPVLVAADLISFANGLNPAMPPEMVYFETDSLRWLKKQIGEHRVICIGKSAVRDWMPSNAPMVYRLPDLQGSDSLWTKRYADFLKALDKEAPGFAVRNINSPLLHLAGVRYVVSAMPLQGYSNLRLVWRGDLWIYENKKVLPRVRGVPAAITKETINTVSIRVCADKTGKLVLADPYYPGWRAFVDGKEEPVFIADYVFRGVLLRAGQHKVTFVFLPTSIKVGIYLSLVAVGILFTALGAMLQKCRQQVG